MRLVHVPVAALLQRSRRLSRRRARPVLCALLRRSPTLQRSRRSHGDRATARVAVAHRSRASTKPPFIRERSKTPASFAAPSVAPTKPPFITAERWPCSAYLPSPPMLQRSRSSSRRRGHHAAGPFQQGHLASTEPPFSTAERCIRPENRAPACVAAERRPSVAGARERRRRWRGRGMHGVSATGQVASAGSRDGGERRRTGTCQRF